MMRQCSARLAVLLAAGVWGAGTFNIVRAAEDAPKGEAAESVTFGSGDRISGHILSIGADGSLRMTAPFMERETALRVAALQLAEFAPTAKEADPHLVLLTNGDRVAGTVSAVTAAQVIVESSAVGKLAIDRQRVKSIRFAADAAPDADENHETVLLANRDKMSADGLTLADGRLNMKGDSGDLSLPLAKASGITFRASALKTAEADPKAIRAWTGRTKLTLDSVELLDDQALAGRAANLGGPVRIERAALKAIIFPQGASPAEAAESVTFLSGDRVSGHIVSIGADGFLRMTAPYMEGGTALRVAALHRAEFAPAAKETDPHLVLLTNGDRVAGTVSSITAAQVILESNAASVPLRGSERGGKPSTRLAGKLAIDRASVKSIRFTSRAAPNANANHETVLLANKDQMVVDSLSFAEGQLNAKGEFGDLSFPLARVGGIAFRASDLRMPAANPKAIRARAGRTTLTLDSVELMDDTALTGRAASFGGPVRIERAALQTIVFGPADPVRFNSDAALNVYYRCKPHPELPREEWKLLGSTPATAPLTIPDGRPWAVGPKDGHTMTETVAEEMLTRGIPALRLANAVDSDLTSLKELTGLRALILESRNVTDAGLANLKGMTSLPRSNASGSMLRGLQALELISTQVTDAGLANLKEMTGLQSLNLSYCNKVTDAGLANLKGMTNLQTLNLSGCSQLTDAGLTNLKEMTGLHSLDLSFCKQVTGAGLANLKTMAGLQSLILWGTNVTDAGLANLKEMKDLQSLSLIACPQVTDAGLANLKGMTNLQTLYLNFTQVTDAGLANLKEITHLQALRLCSCQQLTGAGLAYLKELPNLQTLDLRLTQITNAGLARLNEMTDLQTLDLGLTSISDDGLANLKGMNNLQTLGLTHDSVTDAGLAKLKGITSLQALDLHGTFVTDAGVKDLKAALPNLQIAK